MRWPTSLLTMFGVVRYTRENLIGQPGRDWLNLPSVTWFVQIDLERLRRNLSAGGRNFPPAAVNRWLKRNGFCSTAGSGWLFEAPALCLLDKSEIVAAW